MEEKEDVILRALEEVTLSALKHLQAALTYEGDNPKYMAKGNLGAKTLAAYTRLKATRTNEKALALMERRQGGKITGNDSELLALPKAI